MEDELANQLLGLARKTQYGLSAFLTEAAEEFIIGDTKTSIRTYYLQLDSKGLPRLKDLHLALARHIIDYAIPRTKIIAAAKEYDETQSTAKLVSLADKSRELFTSLDKTGEGGELLLFAFCEQVLKLPLVIAKMNLKTDTEMHFHGADGVYAGLTKDGNLSLYWGESKVYGNRSKAADDCFESLSKLLITNGGADAEVERDFELLRDYSDLGNEKLTEQLQSMLMSENPEFNDIEFRAVCLIGFSDDTYPKTAHTISNENLKDAVRSKIEAYSKSISHYVDKHKLKRFEIISICLPIPSADEFREQFLKSIMKK